MYGTLYGISFANCGRSEALRCEATHNTIQPKKGSDPFDGSGIDLNRAHNALVSGNALYGAEGYYCFTEIECRMGMGITVDDTQNATIESNSIEGAVIHGIVLANGAIAAHKPWWTSGNYVLNNTVIHNGEIGLVDARDESDAKDHNIYNVWGENTIFGNGWTGCYSNAQATTFYGNDGQDCSPQ